MKIIFSRKGFDGGSGGVPSPILPDGRMISLPIPQKNGIIRYNEIEIGGYNLGDIVPQLTKNKIKPTYKAHLDPDLDKNTLQRAKGWKPIFGQVGAAQGHLKNNEIEKGDLFIFFGLFREVIIEKGIYKFRDDSRPKHVIWGWMQIEDIEPFASWDHTKYPWANYHPHINCIKGKNNTIYIGKDSLELKGHKYTEIPGAGTFKNYNDKLLLTATGENPGKWKLPIWIFPKSESTALTYHGGMDRWSKNKDHVLLQTVGRGQEFVLDCEFYDEAIRWAKNLLSTNSR